MWIGRRAILLLLAGLTLTPVLAQAQTNVQFYIVPKAVVADSDFPGLVTVRPKYVGAGDLGVDNDVVGWTALNFGSESLYIIGFAPTPAQDSALSAKTDVLAFPSNMGANVSATAVTKIQGVLETAHITGDWVNTGLTYLQVARITARIVNFRNRLEGTYLLQTLFAAGVTVDTRLNQLPAGVVQKMNAAAQSLGLDTSTITNSMTIRQAFAILAQQAPTSGLSIAGITL